MKFLNSLCIVLAFSAVISAQTSPSPAITRSTGELKNQLFLGYMYGRSDYSDPIKNYNGGVAQFDGMIRKHVGVALDLSVAKSNLDSTQLQLLFGPRFQFGGPRNLFGITPWIGYGYINRTTPQYTTHETGPSYGIGGDWSVLLSEHFSYRIGADYLRPPFGQDKNTDWLRVTTGIGIRF